MAKIGYIRVSTNDQNTDLQRNALISAECEQIFDDKMSGSKANRPGLKRALKALKTGDTLVVSRWPHLRTARAQNPLSKSDRQHRHQYPDGQVLLSRHECPGGDGARVNRRAHKRRSCRRPRPGPYWWPTSGTTARPGSPDKPARQKWSLPKTACRYLRCFSFNSV